jgi:hypothetical protein
MSWKRKQKPKFPCPYCGKKHYHLCDALLCADLQKVYKMNQIKIIKKKLRSMRFSEKEVKKETSQNAKYFIYGYTECINDILEYLTEGGDGLPEHKLK